MLPSQSSNGTVKVFSLYNDFVMQIFLLYFSLTRTSRMHANKHKSQSALIRNPENELVSYPLYILARGEQPPKSTLSPCTRCRTAELVALYTPPTLSVHARFKLDPFFLTRQCALSISRVFIMVSIKAYNPEY